MELRAWRRTATKGVSREFRLAKGRVPPLPFNEPNPANFGSGVALGVNPNIKTAKAPRRSALPLGLCLPLICLAIDAIISAVTPFVSSGGHFGFMSPAMGETVGLTKRQSDALDAYNNALKNFESQLARRRAQLDSNQRLPDLPGQALYLARNDMISAYKDLTDALPSRIGRPNKFGIPPAYLDAQAEPLLD